jgi:FkbM family methyltransferase
MLLCQDVAVVRNASATVNMLRYISTRLARVWWVLVSFQNPLTALRIYLGLQKSGEQVVLVLRNGVKCCLASNNLHLGFHLFREVWGEKAYGDFNASTEDACLLIDVGAHIGTFAVYAATRLPKARVYCYEPDDDNRAVLEENVRLNRLESRIRIYPFAIADYDGPIRFYRSNLAPSRHSLAQDGFLHTEDAEVTEVEARTLRSVLEDIGADRCDFLKLDCEGAEARILESTRADLAVAFPYIVMEYHDGIGGTTLEGLRDLLQGEGYGVEVEPNPEEPCLGMLFAAQE